jgi:hypothetical protein
MVDQSRVPDQRADDGPGDDADETANGRPRSTQAVRYKRVRTRRSAPFAPARNTSVRRRRDVDAASSTRDSPTAATPTSKPKVAPKTVKEARAAKRADAAAKRADAAANRGAATKRVAEPDDGNANDAHDADDDDVVEVSSRTATSTKSGAARAADSTDIVGRRSDRSVKWAVDRLDSREKRLSFAASGASAAFGILIYIEETHNHAFRLAKNQLDPHWTLILGIVAGVLLLGATFLGRRAPVGFVALFTGAMFTGSSLIFGLPFIALALWLLYHSYKIQKETAAKARAARAESGRSGSTSRSSAVASRGAGGTRGATAAKGAARGARAEKAKGPARPEANKRFTPKRPPPPAPKPSRKERKAAPSSD